MNRDLINYVEFVELMKREENNELIFEKALDYLSNNMLYVTKDQLDDIYRVLYIKIKLHNVADGPSVFKKEGIKLYNIEYDFDDEDALFTISITLDYKVIRTIHINATIQKKSIGDMDAFVEQYDNILINKITLIDFEKIVDYFNKNYEQKFVYHVSLKLKDKYVLFYEVEDNKVINSYYFQWELEK